MNQKKLILFDIDGTLLDHKKQLSTYTVDAIKELRHRGHSVALATGRAPFMFKDIRETLSITSYISFNGQYVVLNDEPIMKVPLKKTALKKLHDTSIKMGHPLVFMNHETMKSSVHDHPNIHNSLGSLNFLHPESDPTFYEDKEIYQTLLFCPHEEEEHYINQYEDFHFIRWHEVTTDVLPRGGSKAKGIESLINKLGFKQQDVIAFGDGPNDLEMLSFAGIGVAMGNATAHAKEVADLVTKNVDDQGIVYGLQQLKLL